MQIHVKVIPGAKKNMLKEEGGRHKIYLTAPAVEGKANKALIEFLSDHFGVRKRQVEIVKGIKAREKLVRIV